MSRRNGSKTLEINNEVLGNPDKIVLNGKTYFPEYTPEEGETYHIHIQSYTAEPSGYLTGTFVGQGSFIKEYSWSPRHK